MANVALGVERLGQRSNDFCFNSLICAAVCFRRATPRCSLLIASHAPVGKMRSLQSRAPIRQFRLSDLDRSDLIQESVQFLLRRRGIDVKGKSGDQ